MGRPIRPRACWGRLISEMAAIRPTLIQKNPFLFSSFSVGRSSLSVKEEMDETHLEVPSNLIHELEVKKLAKVKDEHKLFDEMRRRFLSFKKHKYLENLEHFQALAELQAPKVIEMMSRTLRFLLDLFCLLVLLSCFDYLPSLKFIVLKLPWILDTSSQVEQFMVISCVDSRVCPSNILGFQPGEAFTVRNVANIVPPWENGPTETNAALEFAVNTLEVENILVIGHSSCAGIQSLMSMEDNALDSSFVHKWVVNAKAAKLRAKAAGAHLSFDQQCKHCEKESINLSLKNLMMYPWIEERLKQEMISVHGGYYDFLTCTFEKWTLDYKNTSRVDNDDDHGCLIKDQSIWC
ncbi:beta carbonic anhydrase 5, chloroplastic-like isoform X2 [Benincasa hispida]|uniref:beta carbonic anhydrase 5, chloroplastic-like isoform X2 n=1 Tax=Benincasa hispida TaxID=102211 RepID=UPI00190031AB|nr:beta carbonic anhydrase 5, chloroplastic-like isoform X2 [Benincasa hispida]